MTCLRENTVFEDGVEEVRENGIEAVGDISMNKIQWRPKSGDGGEREGLGGGGGGGGGGERKADNESGHSKSIVYLTLFPSRSFSAKVFSRR